MLSIVAPRSESYPAVMPSSAPRRSTFSAERTVVYSTGPASPDPKRDDDPAGRPRKPADPDPDPDPDDGDGDGDGDGDEPDEGPENWRELPPSHEDWLTESAIRMTGRSGRPVQRPWLTGTTVEPFGGEYWKPTWPCLTLCRT
jgi:hypothetical protein